MNSYELFHQRLYKTMYNKHLVVVFEKNAGKPPSL
jgi:hypothetical protein